MFADTQWCISKLNIEWVFEPFICFGLIRPFQAISEEPPF